MYTYELYFKLCLKQATTTTTITSVCIFFKQNQKQNIKKNEKKTHCNQVLKSKFL